MNANAVDAPDTETLLAVLASLLDDQTIEHSRLLDALISHNGNVNAAASTLNKGCASKRRASPTPRPSSKRKRGLDGWLKPTSTSSPEASTSQAVSDRDVDFPARIKPRSSVHASSVSAKPVIDLMSILRAPTSTTSTPERMPPMVLTTPALVASNVPCTLHRAVLPPELASLLFHTMIDESKGWQRNKWWLFDRLVTSPHRTAFYARRSTGEDPMLDEAESWYRGRPAEPALSFPPAMEQACAIIEEVVNTELRKRQREPLEWDGDAPDGKVWRANVAGSNCYEGAKETVGYHTDALTHLGPYPTIASLSLGTSRTFRLRDIVPAEEVGNRQARTIDIPLSHNSLLIMHAGTQERFKHSVPPQSVLDVFMPRHSHPSGAPATASNCRINITFRFFRPDFAPATTPRCGCGAAAVLRPDAKRRAKPGREEDGFRYWWCCDGKSKDEGKGCGFWKVMDVEAEGRGPFVRDRQASKKDNDAQVSMADVKPQGNDPGTHDSPLRQKTERSDGR